MLWPGIQSLCHCGSRLKPALCRQTESKGKTRKGKIWLLPHKVTLGMYVLAYISSARELEPIHACQGILDHGPGGFIIF